LFLDFLTAMVEGDDNRNHNLAPGMESTDDMVGDRGMGGLDPCYP
jgi:hypothetical protein